MLHNRHNYHFFPSMDWKSLAKYVLFKTGEAKTELTFDRAPVRDINNNVIQCEGTWNAPKVVNQFVSAIGALHIARGQRGEYRDVCRACCSNTSADFNGCAQHRGDPRRWRRGEPRNEPNFMITITKIRRERANYVENGCSYLLPHELHLIRDSLITRSNLESLQLWVMLLLGTRLFLRSEELLNLKINNPANPNATDNCINWHITLLNANNDIPVLAFNIRGKSDHRAVVLAVWEEHRVAKMDVIRPFLAYIHLAKLRGGFLFPDGDQLAELSAGTKVDGIATKAMPYSTYLEKVKAACKPHVLFRDKIGTHITRKTAYAQAAFGGGQDMDIMKAARHKSEKSAVKYSQDSRFMKDFITTSSRSLGPNAPRELVETELRDLVPTWRSIFCQHHQLAASINVFTRPQEKCIKKIADTFIRHNCKIPQGGPHTISQIVDAATYYQRASTEREDLSKMMEALFERDASFAKELNSRIERVISEEVGRAVARALLASSGASHENGASSAPTTAASGQVSDSSAGIPPAAAELQSTAAAVPPAAPSNTSAGSTSAGKKRKREGTNDLSRRKDLTGLKTGGEKLDLILSLNAEGEELESKDLTGGAWRFLKTDARAIISCYQLHFSSDRDAFLAKWGCFSHSTFQKLCCNGEGNACGPKPKKQKQ
ncbi:hypothetical protein HDU96_002116 [Phlyctochytrium bullatum]|nr:hypothetical protein HDU96_002116 [Phlyctochytrium bullatum]